MAPPAVGGVCAHLDYELDQMADYVSDMAQRIVLPGSPVSPAFRKFCSSILSSTRLPSTTILLGMNYLARRMNHLNSAGPYKASDGQVWRMLTVGLLLGSKFLDDNTFQNRSWSEVSGIPVSELNTMEQQWLVGMEWRLYVNLDKSEDFKAWLENWRTWKQAKDLQRASTIERLAPLPRIDTDVSRVQSYSTRPAVNHTGPKNREPKRYDPYYEQSNNMWNGYPTPSCTPPSIRNSAVSSPLEQMSATGGGPRWNDWTVYNQYARAYQPPNQSAYNATRVAAYHTPFTNHYGHQYGGNPWETVADCSCSHCNQHVKQTYFMGHGYGLPLMA